MASGDTSFPQEIFKRHVTAMRIGYDHATIALPPPTQRQTEGASAPHRQYRLPFYRAKAARPRRRPSQ
jgi:hypothetical protein